MALGTVCSIYLTMLEEFHPLHSTINNVKNNERQWIVSKILKLELIQARSINKC